MAEPSAYPESATTDRSLDNELWRQDFLQRFNDKMAALRRDEEAWEDYLAEAEMTSVADGID